MPLRISIEFERNDEPPRTWITCPECDRMDWYYTLWIEKCDLCGACMKNIHNINTDLKKRIRFHTIGLKNE